MKLCKYIDNRILYYICNNFFFQNIILKRWNNVKLQNVQNLIITVIKKNYCLIIKNSKTNLNLLNLYINI